MGKVRFGIVLPDFPEDMSRGQVHVQNIFNYLASLDSIFESVWLGDHFTLGVFTNLNKDVLECFTALTYLSAKFPNFFYGPLTLASSFRNPALLAKISSTFSVMSGGRFILGIGAGWNKEEYLQYGYNFPSNRARIMQMEEAIQIIKLLWTKDNVTFKGKYCHVENAYCNPKPDPVPPILIGGGGEKYLLKTVAMYADWWNGWCYDVETWNHKLNVLLNHCENIGRDLDEILKTMAWVVALADSDEEAKKLVESSPFPSRWILHGSPESIVSQIGELVDAGVEYFQLGFTHFPNMESTKMFIEKVIPNL